MGGVTITRFADFEDNPATDPKDAFPLGSADEVRRLRWLFPGFADARGWIRSCFAAFLIEDGRLKILVDSLAGPRPPGTPAAAVSLPADLVAAGLPPDSIDMVVNTHLHLDHDGWNTTPIGNDAFAPTFSRARYVMARTDFEYWRDERAEPVWMGAAFRRSAMPLVEAGVADLVSADQQLTPEIRLLPTPGHTPGHVSILIASRGEEAIITGDVLHHPYQLAHPDWESAGDHDPPLAAQTRIDLLNRAAGRGTLLLGSHFVAPGGGRVVRAGSAFRLSRHRAGLGFGA